MTQKTGFSESTSDDWPRERERLLRQSIKDLGLRIEGTYLESLVKKLWAELEAAGIRVKFKVYLSNEWSCPDGVPVIGIPFYLADKRLSKIEDEIMEGVEAETEEQILGYLRHEAGHAFNYAYKLYETEAWHELFGPYSRPYREDYTPNPFSRNFVRHIPGWYAQKHPDEDFAESFAVWLDPESNWREAYRDWGCYKKLLYVDRTVKELGPKEPLVTGADYDFSTEEMPYSVEEHYKRTVPALTDVPAHFDGDLKEIFELPRGKAKDWEPAAAFIASHRRVMVKGISYWTGLYDVLVRSLIQHFIERARALDLRVDPKKGQAALMDLLAFSTTLCMNKLYKGDFIIK
jgi:hypothetical protein